MAPPIKLNFRRLTLRETAKRLGISRARAENILKIIDVVPSPKKCASRSHRRKATASKERPKQTGLHEKSGGERLSEEKWLSDSMHSKFNFASVAVGIRDL